MSNDPFRSRYPGRFIVIGQDGVSSVAIYGATGRSPSSLARRFVRRDSEIYMTAIDATVAREGNAELLEYPAVKVFKNGVVVANGRQIENITELQSRDAKKQLNYALSEEAYEPDEYLTPRITGCIVEISEIGGVRVDGGLHIARSAHNGIDRSSWTVPFESGAGLFISTYGGDDVKPTPSFSGDPRPVGLSFGSAQKAAESVFASFAPPGGETDYRVGVIAIYKRLGQEPEIAIVNLIS